jgi:hypothetical protein
MHLIPPRRSGWKHELNEDSNQVNHPETPKIQREPPSHKRLTSIALLIYINEHNDPKDDDDNEVKKIRD